MTRARDLNAALAATIWQRMKYRGWNVDELARRSGIARRSLYTYMEGERGFPLVKLQDLAHALGETTASLIAAAEQFDADVGPLPQQRTDGS